MKIRVVSPWYPDYASAYSGVFVAHQVAVLRASGHEVTVEVPQVYPAPRGPIHPSVLAAMKQLADRNLDDMFHRVEGTTFVPTPNPSGGGHWGKAMAMTQSLKILRERHADAPDIAHAHLGLPTGWAVAQTNPDIPLIITEHQSTLAEVLTEPAAARAYEDVLRTARAFICVSPHLRDQLAGILGHWVSERTEVIPNVVDVSEIQFRTRPRLEFRRWIYVGGLVDHKGVPAVVRAFLHYRRHHDRRATLTLVGDGPLREWVERTAAQHELEDSIVLTGGVPHQGLAPHLHRADLMVHLSPSETFGIAPLEAIAAGVPVVGLRHLGARSTWGQFEDYCGTLLDLGSGPSEVSDAVAQLRDSPNRLDLERGRKQIEDRYSPMVIAQQLESVYERVL